MSEEAVVERRLEATDEARALFEESCRTLLDDPSRVLSPGANAEARRMRQYATEMTVDTGGGSSTAQGVVVELGLPQQSAEALVCGVAWRPAGRTRFLPVFHGSLELRPESLHTRLRLHGTYRPPLGPVGAFGDSMVGHRVARQTIAGFLRTVAQRIEEDVDRRTAEGPRPAPYPLDLRDEPPPNAGRRTLESGQGRASD